MVTRKRRGVQYSFLDRAQDHERRSLYPGQGKPGCSLALPGILAKFH